MKDVGLNWSQIKLFWKWALDSTLS